MSDPRQIIGEWLNGDPDGSGTERLREWLRESDANVREFALQVMLHQLLRELAKADSELPSACAGLLAESGPGARQAEPARPSRRWTRPLLVGAALLLPLLAWLVGRAVVARPTAVVVRSTLGPEAGLVEGGRLQIGSRLRFGPGEVGLRFDSGVDLSLAGPADLEVLSETRAFLRRGQVTASVEARGRGFTVVTPNADVIDLGTRFGVSVAGSGKADVVVFDGLVDVDGRSRGGDAVRRSLMTGEAVQIGGRGSFDRIAVVRQGESLADWSTGVGGQSSVIVGVTDNLPKAGRAKFYGVVAGGFDEDSRAYGDRIHEWNSLPGVAFPEELRGADYIRTFNEHKIFPGLQMTVEISRPASIYLLFDRRVPPPDWLRRDFRLTNLAIGSDEGTSLETDDIEVQTGPGNGVNRVFDIWVRDLHEARPVTFGSLIEAAPDAKLDLAAGSSQAALSMYGIVVVPFSAERPPPAAL